MRYGSPAWPCLGHGWLVIFSMFGSSDGWWFLALPLYKKLVLWLLVGLDWLTNCTFITVWSIWSGTWFVAMAGNDWAQNWMVWLWHLSCRVPPGISFLRQTLERSNMTHPSMAAQLSAEAANSKGWDSSQALRPRGIQGVASHYLLVTNITNINKATINSCTHHVCVLKMGNQC